MKNKRRLKYKWAIVLGSCLATFAWAGGSDRVLTKEQRLARNYELARKMYDAYVNLSKLGYPDMWKKEDVEPGQTVYIFDKAHKKTEGNPKRNWGLAGTIDKPQDFKDLDWQEYTAILKVIPDWKMQVPFKAFCSEEGCALQMFMGGHDSSGKYYECDGIEFFWTNERGRVTREEGYWDYVNTPDFLARIAGVSREKLGGSMELFVKAVPRIAGERPKRQ